MQAPAQRHFCTGSPQREPYPKSRRSLVSPALGAVPSALHTHWPVACCDVARGDSWPGVTHAQGCAWACWLTSPWPLARGPPAWAATRERREAKEPRQTGPTIWSIGLSWDGSVLGRKEGGVEITAGGKTSRHPGGAGWRGRSMRG